MRELLYSSNTVNLFPYSLEAWQIFFIYTFRSYVSDVIRSKTFFIQLLASCDEGNETELYKTFLYLFPRQYISWNYASGLAFTIKISFI